MVGRLILASILSDGRMSRWRRGVVRSQTFIGRSRAVLSERFGGTKTSLVFAAGAAQGWRCKGFRVGLDSTLVSRQGTRTENTFSTKNNPRRSRQKKKGSDTTNRSIRAHVTRS